MVPAAAVTELLDDIDPNRWSLQYMEVTTLRARGGEQKEPEGEGERKKERTQTKRRKKAVGECKTVLQDREIKRAKR